jgi:hypothetical protein
MKKKWYTMKIVLVGNLPIKTLNLDIYPSKIQLIGYLPI